MNLLIALTLLTVQEQTPNKRDPHLPTAAEIRAYYLDKDGRPAEAKDVKASLVFESPEGKTRAYPMTWTAAKEDEKIPAYRQYGINGTDYRFAVCATYTDASVPGGTTHYDKPFLRDLPVPVEPERKVDVDEPKEPPFAKSGYFRTYLNKHEIDAIADGPYTDVSVLFTIRGDQRKTKCFSCREGVMTSSSKVSDDLKTLEKQIEAGEWDKAKVTMSRVKQNVDAMPASPADNRVKDDCATCCKELESAVNAEKKDKALKELHKLQLKCESCDANPSEKKK